MQSIFWTLGCTGVVLTSLLFPGNVREVMQSPEESLEMAQSGQSKTNGESEDSDPIVPTY